MKWYVPYIEVEEEGRYLFTGPHRTSWVRLVVVESGEHNRVLGLVEDVTHEIETRRRIEHERDHDILTGCSTAVHSSRRLPTCSRNARLRWERC